VPAIDLTDDLDALQRLPGVAQRFVRYVQIDTQSDPTSETTPSTEKQKDLSRLLAQELGDLGADDVAMDEYGYVFATIPSTLPEDVAAQTPTLALLAHVDTSPDAPGANVIPTLHPDYDGSMIRLPGNPEVTLDPERQPALLDHCGHDLLTSDGTTLLGSDDKAGVAILMQLVEHLLADRSIPCPPLRICFTVDEEIGRGVDKLDLDRLGADVAYTLDGSSTDLLYAETFNAAKATVTVRGTMVHPGYAKGVMVNAVRILAELISLLPEAEAPETTDGYDGYLHPHTLHAGDPEEAAVLIILRDFTGDGLQRRKDLVADIVQFLRRKHPKAEFALEVEDQYKNMRSYIAETDPRAVAFAHAAAETIGMTLEEDIIRGGTDGSRLSELGLPTPNVFNGGHDYHSRFEWNTVQNLERSLRYTTALVQYWAEHGRD
jgi:tripeptide aminopeptidase